MIDGDPARAQLPDLVQPRRGLWHRGDRRDADRRRADRGRAVQPVEVEPVRSRARCSRSSSPSTCSISAPTCSRFPIGGWFPLLIGAIAFTLLTTWARGRRADDPADERGKPADRGVHQVRRAQRDARRRHRGVHDQLDQRRAARAAPQPQAQQGAPRAHHAADGADRGRAVRRRGPAQHRHRLRPGLLPHPAALWLHGGNRRARGAVASSRAAAPRAR